MTMSDLKSLEPLYLYEFNSRPGHQVYTQGVVLNRQPLLNPMEILIQLVKFVPPFVAALILGHWFHKELKKARALGKPWYAPYLTPPAIMIAAILIALVSIRIFVF